MVIFPRFILEIGFGILLRALEVKFFFSIPTVVQDSHIMNGPLQCTDTKTYTVKFTCTDNLLQAKTKMPDEIENLFSLMDFAHNGKISEQEFLAATGHYRSPRFIF